MDLQYTRLFNTLYIDATLAEFEAMVTSLDMPPGYSQAASLGYRLRREIADRVRDYGNNLTNYAFNLEGVTPGACVTVYAEQAGEIAVAAAGMTGRSIWGAEVRPKGFRGPLEHFFIDPFDGLAI